MDNLNNIIPICRDFEDKLNKLVWRMLSLLSFFLSLSALTMTTGSAWSPPLLVFYHKTLKKGQSPLTIVKNQGLSPQRSHKMDSLGLIGIVNNEHEE